MKDEAAGSVADAIEHLVSADVLSVSEGVSRHFLQVLNGENGETVVQGNAEGLVYLALSILRLATKQNGAHQHFDESGLLDRCEVPLVVAKCLAEWEVS